MPRAHICDRRWDVLLDEFRRSGLTHAEFCQRRGLSIHSFRKRLYQTTTTKSIPAILPPADRAADHFFPVTIRPEPIPTHSASREPLELLLDNGRRIAVAPGFDPRTLRQLIAVVEERPCSD